MENPAIQTMVESNLSQTDLSKKLKVSLWHLNRVVNRKALSRPLEYRIAKYFKKEIHELFPDRKRRNSAGLVPPRQPESGL